MNVKRYSPYIDCTEDTLEIIGADMKRSVVGGYVLHSDYAALLARVARLEEALRFYAAEDAESVDDGILESVYHRPATGALEDENGEKWRHRKLLDEIADIGRRLKDEK